MIEKLTKKPQWISRAELWLTILGISAIVVIMSAILALNFSKTYPEHELFLFPFGSYDCSGHDSGQNNETMTCTKQSSNGTIYNSSTIDSPTNIKIEVI